MISALRLRQRSAEATTSSPRLELIHFLASQADYSSNPVSNAMKSNHKKQAGIIFIDALIAIAIISVAFVALLETGESSIKLSSLLKKKTGALLLAKESVEGVRSFRDGTDWSVDGIGLQETGDGYPYYLALSGGAWSVAPGVEATGIFTRKIIFDRVSRHPSTKDIETPYNPLNDDPDTRKVTVSVAWESSSLQLVTYLTNWR